MTDLVRVCPNCHDERPIDELFCDGYYDGSLCGYALADVDIVPRRGASQSIQPLAATSTPAVTPAVASCLNGHPLEPGDSLCLLCGATISPLGEDDTAEETGSTAGTEEGEPLELAATVVDIWTLDERVSVGHDIWERFFASHEASGRRGFLTLYRPGVEPDPAVHDTLRRMPADHVPVLHATGRWLGRAFDVVERIDGGPLDTIGPMLASDGTLLDRLIDELGRALADFAEVGLRHRDLRPGTILIRGTEPLDLVITGFGSARLSDFDLDAVAPLALTRYSAPEAIVGGVSAASDWWSLGMILLEQVTAGACFAGINETAFHIHVVTRGMSVPASTEPRLRRLLQGLLNRDPLRRWKWNEVQRWLAGEDLGPVDGDEILLEANDGPRLILGERPFTRPEAFALAAAEAPFWDAARDLLLRGAVATWLEERSTALATVATVRTVAADNTMSEDLRLGVALLAMSPALPLVQRGAIVTPAWLLTHAEDGYALLAGSAPEHLMAMRREPWLVRLRSRMDQVRARASLLEVRLDEGQLRPALLTTSRANLEAELLLLRKVYPDAEQPGLAALLDRSRLTDEDLIVLIGAEKDQLLPTASILDAAQKLAGGVPFDPEQARGLLTRPRRSLYDLADERISGFARCGQERIDEWADTLRVERRLPLPRLLILLAVPATDWQAPPKQAYVAHLLEHFEKRVAGAALRGPLVRFVIGKTTPRLDLSELGSAARPSQALLDHVLRRDPAPCQIDPEALLTDPARERRLRHLINHAENFVRDTGIDGRYLGFPFLFSRDTRSVQSGARPRLAPILLWPVRIDLPPGGVPAFGFDTRRREVRLNPALVGLVGQGQVARWRELADRLLAQDSPRTSDVMDTFGSLVATHGRTLIPLPGKDATLPAGRAELICAATLFNAEFIGQSLAEDLRQLRAADPAQTALEIALRVSDAVATESSVVKISEAERFTVVDGDPSQDRAVLRSRSVPGLLIEGPPGTGKSQTVVNTVADSIGRSETVLVVCQKQAALRVVQKRLEAEGLGDRLVTITDVNADRSPVIQALREQLGKVVGSDPAGVAKLRRERAETARAIDLLESEIDRHHRMVHTDDEAGMSYRRLVGELIELEAGPYGILGVPGLRRRLAGKNTLEIENLADCMGPLAATWRVAAYEGSPLAALKPFLADAEVARELSAELGAFVAIEERRTRDLAMSEHGLPIVEPEPFRTWLKLHHQRLADLPQERRRNLGLWLHLVLPPGGTSRMAALVHELELQIRELDGLDPEAHDPSLFASLARLPRPELEDLVAAAVLLTTRASFWRRLTPAWRRRRKGFLSRLAALRQPATEPRMKAVRDAACLETALRAVRGRLRDIFRELRIEEHERDPLPLRLLQDRVRGLIGALRPLLELIPALATCPASAELTDALRLGTAEAYTGFCDQIAAGLLRHEARSRSEHALAALDPWLDEAWIRSGVGSIASDTATNALTAPLLEAMSTLETYQLFRLRAQDLPSEALELFALMRHHLAIFAEVPNTALDDELRRVLRREARLAWKADLEARYPVLLEEEGDLRRKAQQLAQKLATMREHNRRLLAVDIATGGIGVQAEWDKLLKQRGVGRKSLREIVGDGRRLGLFAMRPVWLLNPEVASSLLPRTPGIFDLVIFDEASQILVENAVPALFRAKRMVVSGDEKQMPPTSFFAARPDPEEDEDLSGDDEDAADEAMQAHLEESWNRRDIKDCPDLLELARKVLPATTLAIHYRSEYRELIGFSNAAFYRNQLNIPARHPAETVCASKPIEVVRVDGVYTAQTNRQEAVRVVELLAAYWAGDVALRPSIGVVTFNRKQADLIDDVLQERALEDDGLRIAWLQERERRQDGEDMGFFVKNVENVQGDERDVMIFSTTFGRDAKGSFRRNFGVLGQVGGERRLNVAVTRARRKIILVTSIPPNEVSDFLTTHRMAGKPRDYLQAYLDYAHKISGGQLDAAQDAMLRLAPASTKPGQSMGVLEDGFAASVLQTLRELGHEPVSSGDGDAFRVDFAIRHPTTGLFGIAIECDAPRHELYLSAARAREVWRPAVLSRTIPTVHRVTSRGWYHRRAEEKARLAAVINSALDLKASSGEARA